MTLGKKEHRNPLDVQNWLVKLLRGTGAICSESHMKHTNNMPGERQSGKWCNHSAFEGFNIS
jgi:hypothetical protein